MRTYVRVLFPKFGLAERSFKRIPGTACNLVAGGGVGRVQKLYLIHAWKSLKFRGGI